jgi:phosphomannomutase
MQEELDAVQRYMRGDFRAVLRPSGTEPIYRVWGEGRDERSVPMAVKHLADTVRQIAFPGESGDKF